MRSARPAGQGLPSAVLRHTPRACMIIEESDKLDWCAADKAQLRLLTRGPPTSCTCDLHKSGGPQGTASSLHLAAAGEPASSRGPCSAPDRVGLLRMRACSGRCNAPAGSEMVDQSAHRCYCPPTLQESDKKRGAGSVPCSLLAGSVPQRLPHPSTSP